jgi:hypothetical protein
LKGQELFVFVVRLRSALQLFHIRLQARDLLIIEIQLLLQGRAHFSQALVFRVRMALGLYLRLLRLLPGDVLGDQYLRARVSQQLGRLRIGVRRVDPKELGIRHVFSRQRLNDGVFFQRNR